MVHHVELLWFGGCPNHPAARAMVQDAMRGLAPDATFEEIDASDAAAAEAHHFPGSPTVRIDGTDVERDSPIRATTRRAAASTAPRRG